ncbi:14 kDa proline-rich protein DC2.15-like [Vigna unguiculata]|uniref:Bifunctional inhibitor/plant lipid transfer protein/seed storage helical domain-containing protein n=1 Tax=Vigna unguiculata TaxID=3917 RepID=A0A4D6NJD1_VIGUN|nr:14 kDa proline-rich protein DC2.15-like [Vigna unguiculata]QCE13900.1 hypothetical protein DEO72_LG11g898 [Vigna unguiculata]
MGLSEYIAVVVSLCLVSVSIVNPQAVPGAQPMPPVIRDECPENTVFVLRLCVLNLLNITVGVPPPTTAPSCCALLTPLPVVQARICVGNALNRAVPGLPFIVSFVTDTLLNNCP